MFDVFLEILVCNLTLNKYEMYKKVFRGALKLQRPLFLQSMWVARIGPTVPLSASDKDATRR